MAVANRTRQCGFCDRGTPNISNRASSLTTQIPQVADVVFRLNSANLPSLPDSSLEDGESVNSERGEDLDRGPSPQEKGPKESKCEGMRILFYFCFLTIRFEWINLGTRTN